VEIKVLGKGCAKCRQLEEDVRRVVSDLGVNADVQHVTDIKEIMSYKVMGTPALVINGKVKVSGRLPQIDEIKKYINEEL